MASLSLVPLEDDDPRPNDPLTLDEVKLHCRVDGEEDDALLVALIGSVAEHVQHITGRQIIRRDYALRLDEWPCVGWIDVPRAPLIEVDSITYLDGDGSEQTLAESQYRVSAPTGPTARRGSIEPAYGVSWPAVRCVSDCITVNFAAGYGATADKVPDALKQAMLLIIGHFYENRETVIVSQFSTTAATELPLSAKWLLAPFRTWPRQ